MKVPSLTDERPWAQGFNDWLAFGNGASAFARGEIGFEEYERGKAEACSAFNKIRSGFDLDIMSRRHAVNIKDHPTVLIRSGIGVQVNPEVIEWCAANGIAEPKAYCALNSATLDFETSEKAVIFSLFWL